MKKNKDDDASLKLKTKLLTDETTWKSNFKPGGIKLGSKSGMP